MKGNSQTSGHDNGIWALGQLVGILKIKVTSASVRNVAYYSDYPSMKSLSDALHIWNIPNMVIGLSSRQLEEIPVPAIAHFSDQYFVVLKNVKNNQVCYLHPQDAEITELISDFEKKWSGNILIVQPDGRSGEANYKSKLRSQKLNRFFRTLALILLSVVALSPFFYFEKSDLVFYTLTLAGAFVSGLILHHQSEQSHFTSRLCNWGKNMNCNNVLQSAGSQLLSINVSELAAVYFFGGMMSYWIGSVTGLSPLPVLSKLNGIAILFSAYLVYYQLRLNKWCSLCLIVTLILIIEFAAALNHVAMTITFRVSLVTGLSFLILIASWLLIRNLFFRASEIPALQRMVQQLKSDEKIFSALLDQSSAVQFEPEGIVTVGSKEPLAVIGLFSQPECSPCANAHQIVENLLLRNPEKIAVQVTLLANPARRESDTWKIAFHFLALKIYVSSEIAFDALSQWYRQRNSLKAKEWIEQFPVESQMDHAMLSKILADDFEKSNTAGVKGTPAIYINNKKLPTQYDVSDLLLHLNHLLSREEVKRKTLV